MKVAHPSCGLSPWRRFAGRRRAGARRQRQSEDAEARRRRGGAAQQRAAGARDGHRQRGVEARLDGIADRLDAGEPVAPRELFSLVMEGERALGDYDRITLQFEIDEDRDHVDRLAEYLDADVRYRGDELAVLRLDEA